MDAVSPVLGFPELECGNVDLFQVSSSFSLSEVPLSSVVLSSVVLSSVVLYMIRLRRFLRSRSIVSNNPSH